MGQEAPSKKSKFRNTLRRGFRSTSKFSASAWEDGEEPSLTSSGQLLTVPSEKTTSSSPKNSLRNSGYRTADRKRKRQPASASSIFANAPGAEEVPESLTRVRSQSTAVPPEIIKAAMSNSKRDLPKDTDGSSSGLLHTMSEHAV